MYVYYTSLHLPSTVMNYSEITCFGHYNWDLKKMAGLARWLILV